jgi:DNA-binding protein H-NS
MPKETLAGIQKHIDALVAKVSRLKRKKAPALRRIVELARTNGIAIGEIRAALSGGARKKSPLKKRVRRAPKKVAPMYRNPKTGETWSGRGRMASWLAAAEKAGRKRSEFLIKKR